MNSLKIDKISILKTFLLCNAALSVVGLRNSQKNSYSGVGQRCSISEFSCTNGNCISAAQYCDSNDDCGDASDEPRFCTSKEEAGLPSGSAFAPTS
jgi:Low-density lipoprotein receptor domain class A